MKTQTCTAENQMRKLNPAKREIPIIKNKKRNKLAASIHTTNIEFWKPRWDLKSRFFFLFLKTKWGDLDPMQWMHLKKHKEKVKHRWKELTFECEEVISVLSAFAWEGETNGHKWGRARKAKYVFQSFVLINLFS